MKRILIVGPAWVGDMVMVQSLVQTLHQQVSEAHIDILAPPWTCELTERMPGVRRGISVPFKHGEWRFFERYQQGSALRHQYDQAIILPRAWKAALLPYAARIPQRTGYLGEARFGLINDLRRRLADRTIEQFVALGLPKNQWLNEFPSPQIMAHSTVAASLRTHLQLDDPRPIVGFCPGAEYGPAKRWPTSHFIVLAQQLIAQNYQIWGLGSTKDQPLTAAIASECPKHFYDLAGKTRLNDAIDLLNECSAVVSNDSGLMHLAAALGRPTLGLFGSSSAKKTPPVGKCVKSLEITLDCRPCFQRACRFGHLRCLTELSPTWVLSELQTLLTTECS